MKEAVWDEVYSEWKVEVEDLGTGRIFETKCDILINASGFLNKWTWPDIPGIESFSGTKLHSAAWDHAVVYNEKRIAVIGTGSSAIQIVPQMQKGESQFPFGDFHVGPFC